jgi:predicted patatin/cPLA2 family phospholipase
VVGSATPAGKDADNHSKLKGMLMLGVIDVGGGLRSIYSAGILDYCLEHGIVFDYCVGVAEGAVTLSAYIAKQHGFARRYFMEYIFRSDSMGLKNMQRNRAYLNQEYLWDELAGSNGESPFDYGAFNSSDQQLTIVATDIWTGQPTYFTKKDIDQNEYSAFKAATCPPAINPPCVCKGKLYYSGFFSDPIPLELALDSGCDRIILLLTRPRYDYDTVEYRKLCGRILRRKYPLFAERIINQPMLYKEKLETAMLYERKRKLYISAPQSVYDMKTYSKNELSMKILYQEGHRDARWLRRYLERG